jgi:ADP-heptose:LPS heptosyltransferase
VILTSFHQSALPTALLLRLAGVPVIAAVSDDYPGSLLDVRHRVPDDMHEVHRGLSTVATLGYHLPDRDLGALAVHMPAVAPRSAGPAPVIVHSHLAGPRPVVVHPGASVAARTWGADRWAALVDALVTSGHRVLVTGAPAERGLTGYVAGFARPGVTDLGGRVDFAGLARTLAGAAAVVVGNTGPAHLAAAVRTPVVSLFAPTVPAARWRPWGVPHILLGDQDIPCADCRARTCPVPGHPCLGTVPVSAVVEAVERLAPRARPRPVLRPAVGQ